MSQILNKVRNLDPHDVDAAKEAISAFFPNLTKHKECDCVRWLRSLEIVINRFPKLCGSQRGTIEKYITHFLDAKSYNSVIEAAKCAHVLQQVRPGQEKAATPKVCWRDLMGALCNAVHSLIFEIFPNAANIYKNNGDEEKQTSSDTILLSALSEIAVLSGQDRILNRENILSTRLRNVFVFIQAMLVEIYPVAKPVRPQLILDAVIRALGASADVTQTELVASVKQQALRTLDALVACLGSNLIPFSPLVFKCVMQTFRWSSDNPNEDSSAVRIAAYGGLGAWLAALRAPRAAAWHAELLAHVTGDVTPATRTVQLSMNNQTRNLSRKQKKKQTRIMLQQSSIAAYSPSELKKDSTSAEPNDQVVVAALNCTEIFLTVCGIFLKPATHKVFHELLVRECFHLDDYNSDRGLALLRALEASRKTAPPGVPPPTQYCLQLYSVMINSQHREISQFCSQALLDIRMHLHCSPPSLNFAAETQTATKKDVEDKRRMSRKNREALESLLGADKLPPETSEIELVPETEEPANKKPRIDDESDKISLSSGSDAVEICESDSEEIEEVPIAPEEINTNNTNSDILEITADVHELSHDNTEDFVDKANIHEATTQMPQHISNDTVDGNDSPKSMEVGYGYPNTGAERVPVLEKLEEDNLPSTNDTDDVQITCGQVLNATPDYDKKENDLNEEVKVNDNEPKVNGVKSPEKAPDDNVMESSVTVKIAANNEGVSVEDMLADFVDEVNDDNVTKA